MTLAEIKTQALFQFGNDTDALDEYEFMPHIVDYANEGYEILFWYWKDIHIPDDMKLRREEDVPQLPEWAHRAIADYTTWMLYRNGSSARQNRGQAYWDSFIDCRNRLRSEKNGGHPHHFHHIPL